MAVEFANEDLRTKGIIQAIHRGTPSQVQAIQEVADAVRPQVREVHKVSNERRA